MNPSRRDVVTEIGGLAATAAFGHIVRRHAVQPMSAPMIAS